MNFASSFIAFVEENLLDDDNMRTVLAGIRIMSKKFLLFNCLRIPNEKRLDG
jgi:hypothetical protein